MLYDNYNNEIYNIETKEIDGEIFFKARNICDYLSIKNITDATYQLNNEDKKLISFKSKSGTKYNIYVSLSGALFIVCNSRKEKAKDLKRWLINNLKFSNTEKPTKQFIIKNEYDLNKEVTNFIRMNYPHILFTHPCGELQDTSQKRINSYHMGYYAGSPDLIILSGSKYFSGFLLEFKSPTGNYSISNKQEAFLKKSRLNNYKVLLSNDYNIIIKSLIEYFINVRLNCLYCNRRFISENTLSKHCQYFHKCHSYNLDIQINN